MAGKGKKTTGRRNRGEVRGKLTNRRRKRLEAESLNYTAGVLRKGYVVLVNAVDMTVDIQLVQGPNNKPYKGIPISFGACGSRTFMGVMPEMNDQCVVGFAPATMANTRPYIVAWIPNAPRMGRDWVPVSIHSQAEVENTVRVRNQAGPYAPLIRNKTPRLNEGNAFVSSGQGADLILDESATLTNRRGNEVILRDQDQALVVRSVQQFHAGSGFRIYGGIVQRDAELLPTTLFNAHYWWAAPGQALTTDEDVKPSQFPTDYATADTLAPSMLFQRRSDGTRVHPDYGNTSLGLDPYKLLERGLFISPSGVLLGGKISDAVYGGKPVYRVSEALGNAFGDSEAETFTEYRIEVTHTSDGTLPVTEETDGFDADRLPLSGSARLAPTGDDDSEGQPEMDNPPPVPSNNVPFVEMVMGTYIGNDPFYGGKELYGLPICPQLVGSDGSKSPGLVSGVGKPVSEHAAWIVKVQNPEDPTQPPSWMAITKGGAFRQYFSGKGSPGGVAVYDNSQTDIYGGEGYTVQAGGGNASIDLEHTDGSNQDGYGITATSPAAILLHAGAASTSMDATNASMAGEAASMVIKSDTNTSVVSAGEEKHSCAKFTVTDCDVMAQSITKNWNVNSGGGIGFSGATGKEMWTGSKDIAYGGKGNSDPTGPPPLVETFSANAATGILGAAKVREQTLQMGAWDCSGPMVREDHTYKVGSINLKGTGTAAMAAGFGTGVRVGSGVGSQDNSTSHKPTGIKTVGYIGNVTSKAVAGGTSLTSTLAATVKSAAKFGASAPLIQLTSPGVFAGAVLSEGCIDNLTGSSFISSGTVGYSTCRIG